MLNEVKFYSEAAHFLERLFQNLKEIKVTLEPHWEIDHLCYRADSEQSYQSLKKDLASYAKLLIESPVNGRLISTYELLKPVVFEDYEIHIVELPAPKVGKMTASGFEHVEVVCDREFDLIKADYPHANWDEGGRKKVFNAELEMLLGSRNIKFHHLSLQSVIRLEEQKKIHQALIQSEILSKLKSFFPLVVGTFPLGLQVTGSDIDIILSTPDLNEFKKLMTDNGSKLKNFSLFDNMISGKPGCFCKFEYDGIPFEVLAQSLPSTEQPAFLHFQAEERVLRYANVGLTQRIKKLRQSKKTEPAFAEALELDEDPYAALLKIQKMSRAKLKSFLAAKV